MTLRQYARIISAAPKALPALRVHSRALRVQAGRFVRNLQSPAFRQVRSHQAKHHQGLPGAAEVVSEGQVDLVFRVRVP